MPTSHPAHAAPQQSTYPSNTIRFRKYDSARMAAAGISSLLEMRRRRPDCCWQGDSWLHTMVGLQHHTCYSDRGSATVQCCSAIMAALPSRRHYLLLALRQDHDCIRRNCCCASRDPAALRVTGIASPEYCLQLTALRQAMPTSQHATVQYLPDSAGA